MKSQRSVVSMLVMVCLTVVLTTVGAASAHGGPNSDPLSLEVRQLISNVRAETAHFREFEGVEEAGYGKFLDCFVNDNIGGMGQHYVNGDLVSDDVLDPMKPEALVFEPTEDGKMTLVAFEYLVFADKWDPNNTGREAPMLFGQPLHLKTNIPGTPPVWALHIWLWTSNPEGVFADFNPLVFCPSGQPITDLTPNS